MFVDMAMISLLGVNKTKNPEDVRKPCCYKYDNIKNFLKLPEVQLAMNV